VYGDVLRSFLDESVFVSDSLCLEIENSKPAQQNICNTDVTRNKGRSLTIVKIASTYPALTGKGGKIDIGSGRRRSYKAVIQIDISGLRRACLCKGSGPGERVLFNRTQHPAAASKISAVDLSFYLPGGMLRERPVGS
jgi:hypothetical protein